MGTIRRRNPYWDNIKGMLILFVVFAHILYQLQYRFPAIDSIVDYIYMFHMPAFVFVSGYFGKSERVRSDAAIIRLMFLYFVFNSIMGFLFGFESLLEPRYSYWYLLALIAWRLTAHRLADFREITLILFAIAIFAGFYDTIDNTFAASRILAFYPFYMMGYHLTSEKSDALIRVKYSRRLLTGILALATAAIFAYFSYKYFDYSDNAFLMYGYEKPMDAFGRIALFVIAFLAIYAIRTLCPNRNIPLLSMFGRNSLWIFLLHRPFTLWLSGPMRTQNQSMILLLSILSAFALCFVFGNDVIADCLNRFADSGAAIFTGEQTKKFTLAKLVMVLIAIEFVVLIAVDVYFGF